MCYVLHSDGAEQQQKKSRTVIVQRDERGYGFTVTGDNPVSIQTVKESMSALCSSLHTVHYNTSV